MQIRIDDLTGRDVADLLQVHLAYCMASSPPESVHVLDLDVLRAPEISFWTAREAGNLLGCGALKELDPSHGEIKSMHVAARHRGHGVAAKLVRHIVAEARARCYRRLSLETGSMEAFAPARALYARAGFIGTGPFGNYGSDPNSVFMTLDLAVQPKA